jgi:hypothetical protein
MSLALAPVMSLPFDLRPEVLERAWFAVEANHAVIPPFGYAKVILSVSVSPLSRFAMTRLSSTAALRTSNWKTPEELD